MIGFVIRQSLLIAVTCIGTNLNERHYSEAGSKRSQKRAVCFENNLRVEYIREAHRLFYPVNSPNCLNLDFRLEMLYLSVKGSEHGS